MLSFDSRECWMVIAGGRDSWFRCAFLLFLLLLCSCQRHVWKTCSDATSVDGFPLSFSSTPVGGFLVSLVDTSAGSFPGLASLHLEGCIPAHKLCSATMAQPYPGHPRECLCCPLGCSHTTLQHRMNSHLREGTPFQVLSFLEYRVLYSFIVNPLLSIIFM